MSNTEEFDKYYKNVSYELLPELSERYGVVTLLKHEEGKAVVLVREKDSEKKYILKYTENDRDDLEREYEAYGNLHVSDVVFEKEDKYCYLIRPYIEGVSLEHKIENDGVMDSDQALTLLKKLCAKLEGMKVDGIQVIHRDIKPANIILTPDGGVEFIDFECARNYDAEKEKDTVFIGTVYTAAPEQYGYAQSDVRTDIYAIGKTLCYALTEDYKEERLDEFGASGKLKKIIRKCTRFNPEDRYQTINSLKADATGKKVKVRLAVAAAALLIAVIGITVGINVHKNKVVDFGSKSLELAVRAELKKPKGDITYSELLDVRRLAVVGTTTFTAGQEYDCRAENRIDGEGSNNGVLLRGDIEDLSLVKEMKNLDELYLCNQKINDISQLSGLHLKTLALTSNNISDISPLEGMETLETLYIGLNPVENYEPLRSLTSLSKLNLDRSTETISGISVPELSCLSGLPIKSLSLANLEPISGGFSFAESLDKLEIVYLCRPKEEYLYDIVKAPRLNWIVMDNYSGPDMKAFALSKTLQHLDVNDHFASIEGLGQVENLTTLTMSLGVDIDLNDLVGADRLQSVWFFNTDVKDFSPLLKLKGLIDVGMSRKLEEQFNEDCPEHDFIVNVTD